MRSATIAVVAAVVLAACGERVAEPDKAAIAIDRDDIAGETEFHASGFLVRQQSCLSDTMAEFVSD